MSAKQAVEQTTIISDVFIQGYCDPDGIKAGTPRPLYITWREAVRRQNGSYTLKAYRQKEGQKTEDVSGTLLKKDQKPMSKTHAQKAVSRFNSAFTSSEHDIYTGPLSKNKRLSAITIRKHKNRMNNLYFSRRRKPLHSLKK